MRDKGARHFKHVKSNSGCFGSDEVTVVPKCQRDWTAGYGKLPENSQSSVQAVQALCISQLISGQLVADCPCMSMRETQNNY
eukprot:209516-Pelagomonas_calceolata.AAC.2